MDTDTRQRAFEAGEAWAVRERNTLAEWTAMDADVLTLADGLGVGPDERNEVAAWIVKVTQATWARLYERRQRGCVTLTDEADGANVLVSIDETDAPWIDEPCGLTADDEPILRRVRDWGNADWPDDEDVRVEVERLTDRKVSCVEFLDSADGRLDEAIYRVRYADSGTDWDTKEGAT